MTAVFPPLGVKEDSQYFEITRKDVALEMKTDGGWSYSRPRHARRAGRIITTGFTEISTAQKDLIDNFVADNGKFGIFTYTIPTSGEVITARLSSIPKAKYAGAGGYHLWNVTGVEITEV